MRKQFSSELRWLIKQMRPLRRLQALSLLCIILSSALLLLGPLILKWLIDHALTASRGGLMLWGTAVYALTMAGQLAFSYAGYLLNYSAVEKLVFRVRMGRVRKLHNASARYYEALPAGEIQYRLEQDIERVGELGADILPTLLRMSALGIMVLTTMAILNLRLTLLVLPLLPAFYLLQKKYFARLGAAADLTQRTMGGISSVLQEHLLGMVQLQLLNRTGEHGRKLARRAAEGVQVRMQQRRAEIQFSAASMAVVVLGSTIVLGYGGREVMRGALTVGGLVAFYSYVAQLLDPLSTAVDLQSRMQRTGASIRRILEIGEEPQSPKMPVLIAPGKAMAGAALEFDSVSFSHRHDRLVLDGLSLIVREGEKLALVGHSGCGKSTIAHLATGLYVPDKGWIRVEGKDSQDLGRRGIRSLVSLVPQEPVFFDGTLRENLLYGNPHAGEFELELAAELAQLEDVLLRLPRGLDEPLGPLGKKLSGGEKKRVALARVLLQNPRILILDEVTSALDGVTSSRLTSNLDLFRQGRTVVLVSHKPSTIAWADRIVLLENGRVADEGSHLELSRRCRLYQRLVAESIEAS